MINQVTKYKVIKIRFAFKLNFFCVQPKSDLFRFLIFQSNLRRIGKTDNLITLTPLVWLSSLYGATCPYCCTCPPPNLLLKGSSDSKTLEWRFIIEIHIQNLNQLITKPQPILESISQYFSSCRCESTQN